MNNHFLKRRQKSTVTSLKKLNDNIEIFSSSTGFDTEEERNIYIKIKNNITKEYIAMENTPHTNSEKMMVILGLILRLRQVSIHPQIAINALNKISTRDNLSNRLMTFKGPSTKFNNILKIVTNKVALNQNTIIFCHFREEMDSLSLFLKENYIDSRLYNGSMSIKEKEKVLKEFVSPITMKEFKLIYNRLINVSSYDADCAIERHIPKVLLIQIKSGGVGLNLQQFNNVIFTSPDWNPTNQYQAIARAHRIGQKMKVNVYNILINDDNFSTIDDRIRHLQFKKQSIIKKILNEQPTYALLPITEHDEMYPHQTTHHYSDNYLEYTAILQ
jgi:SNF2 family DNA or RNA helicase